mgnify:FL=1
MPLWKNGLEVDFYRDIGEAAGINLLLSVTMDAFLFNKITLISRDALE